MYCWALRPWRRGQRTEFAQALFEEPVGAFLEMRLELAEKLLSWRARHLDRTLTGIELTADGPVDARSG